MSDKQLHLKYVKERLGVLQCQKTDCKYFASQCFIDLRHSGASPDIAKKCMLLDFGALLKDGIYF